MEKIHTGSKKRIKQSNPNQFQMIGLLKIKVVAIWKYNMAWYMLYLFFIICILCKTTAVK